MSGTADAPVTNQPDGSKTATDFSPFRSPDERIAAGKALRDAVPRQSHADWKPSANRRDPIDILKECSPAAIQHASFSMADISKMLEAA